MYVQMRRSMTDEVQKIRERLQDLHDQHTTGFVDDAQYAESLLILERKLVEAVMKQGADEVPSPKHLAADLPPTEKEVPRPQRARAKSLRWLAAAALVHVFAVAVYWWSASRDAPVRPAAAETPVQQPPIPQVSAEASSPAVQSAAKIEMATPAVMPGDTAITGTVTLSPSLAGRVNASDTVFVYAHALNGPAVPLAVIRKQVKDLPIDFRLDDSMSMWSTVQLSSASQVIVTARVSKSGDGKATRGDLQGVSPAISAGTAGLQIEIGSVVDK
jgi:hypothetical protein